MLQNMSSAISGVFGTRVNMMVFGNQPMEKLSELLIRIGRLQYYIVSLILSGYIVFGQIFIDVWAGKDYSQAYIIGLLTMVPLAVPLIQSIAFSVISAQNKLKFRTIVYAVIAVLNVIGTILAMPKFGIIGAAACTAVAFIVEGILVNWYYWKDYKTRYYRFLEKYYKDQYCASYHGCCGNSSTSSDYSKESLDGINLRSYVCSIIWNCLMDSRNE